MQLNALGRAVVAVALMLAVPARAADAIPVIELSPSGPAAPFPRTGTFFLKGDPGGSLTVRPVFVRVRRSAFGASDSCGDVSRALKTLRIQEKKRPLFELGAGRHKVSEIWDTPIKPGDGDADLYQNLRDEDVLLPAAWKGAADAKEYSVLVDDPAFFPPGSIHCFFLFREKEEIKSLNAQLKAAVQKAVATYRKCSDTGDACGKTGQDVLTEELKKILVDVDEPSRAAALTAIRDTLWGAAVKFARGPKALDADFKAWASVLKGTPADDRALVDLAPKTPQAVAVRILARAGELHEIASAPPDGPVSYRYFLAEKNLEVKQVGLHLDQKLILLGNPATPKHVGTTEKLKVDPASLKVPSSVVGLVDLMQLAEGKVLWNGSFVPLETARRELSAILEKGPELSSEEEARVKRLQDWSGNVIEAFREDPRGALRADLDGWLASRIEGCSPSAKEALEAAQISCAPVEGGADARRFGFVNVSKTPFKAVQTHLDQHLAAVRDWNDPKVVDLKVREVTVPAAPEPARLKMGIEHKAFITQLVTPVVGHTWIPMEDRTGSTFSVTFQVSPWANPVDEPMWTNGGEDVWRLPAVELGLGVSDDFDPRAHVKGLGLLAGRPLLIGVALRPLPYLSVSAGVACITEYQSNFAAERGQLRAAPYLNVSVQVNALDAIRSAYSSSSAVTSAISVIP